jgi:hypothetical protein
MRRPSSIYDQSRAAVQLGLGLDPKKRRRSHKVADTSIAAGRQREATGRSVSLRELILSVLKELTRDPLRNGATADELHRATASSASEIHDVRRIMNVRRRVSDLHAAGMIRETPLRRINSEGNPAIVWAAVEVSNG